MKITGFDRYRSSSASDAHYRETVRLEVELPPEGEVDYDELRRVLSALGIRAKKQGEAVLVEPEASRDTGGEPVQAETSRRRRQHARATTDDKRDTDTHPEAQPEANPTTGRRSRRSNSASSETAAASTEASTDGGAKASEPTPARRRRVPEAPAGISDADLTKAASEGARVLGPEFVTAWLTEFGVSEVSKLAQDVRREFLDGISDEIEKAA